MYDILKKANEILNSCDHRPWEIPADRWAYYQEWNRVLFLHWKIPQDILKKLIPSSVDLDTFNNEAWVSLVAFTMEKVRPRNLPALYPVSNFHEVNLRTYTIKENKPGVYFLSIEAQKHLSVWIAKKLSGMDYRKSRIERPDEKNYFSSNKANTWLLKTKFSVNRDIFEKTELDKWLTERYCLYLEENGKTFRYQIHHKEWPIKKADLEFLECNYPVIKNHLRNGPDIVHYSDGVQVLAWNRESI